MLKKKKKVVKTTTYDPRVYVNKETGEELVSELQLKDNEKISLKKQEGSDYYVINSDEFVVIDSDALRNVAQMISDADLAKVLKMSNCLRSPYNIISNKKDPHTAETLANYLEFDQNQFYKMVKRLVRKGILAYVICAPSGYVKKVYLLNPTFARKGKTLHKQISEFFPDLSKKPELQYQPTIDDFNNSKT